MYVKGLTQFVLQYIQHLLICWLCLIAVMPNSTAAISCLPAGSVGNVVEICSLGFAACMYAAIFVDIPRIRSATILLLRVREGMAKMHAWKVVAIGRLAVVHRYRLCYNGYHLYSNRLCTR